MDFTVSVLYVREIRLSIYFYGMKRFNEAERKKTTTPNLKTIRTSPKLYRILFFSYYLNKSEI